MHEALVAMEAQHKKLKQMTVYSYCWYHCLDSAVAVYFVSEPVLIKFVRHRAAPHPNLPASTPVEKALNN